MKSKEFKRRAAAWAMAVTMIFTQTPIATMAEESAVTEQQTEDAAAKAQAEAEAAAKAQAEAEAEAEAAAKAQAEAEAAAKAQAEAEAAAKAQAEAEAAAKAQAEAEAAAKAQAEAEAAAKAQAEADAAAKAQAEADAAAKAQAEAATQAQASAQQAAPAADTLIQDPTPAAPSDHKKETEKKETESEERLNTVTFRNDNGGAKVYVENKEIANLKSKAKDGKIIFTIKVDEQHQLDAVLVDGVKEARKTEHADEYIIEGIKTDNSVVFINTSLKPTEAPAETEVATEANVVAEETAETEEATAESTEEVADEITTEELVEILTEANTEVEMESAMPAKDFTGTTASGISVNVSAQEGVFPEGTTMTVSDVRAAVAQAAAANAEESGLLGENKEVADVIGVDITFRNREGQKIEPADNQKIKVSIVLNTSVEGEDYTLVHQKSNGAVEEVSGSVSGEGADFRSGDFSVYLIIGSNESNTGDDASVTPSDTTEVARVTFDFYNGDRRVDTQTVKATNGAATESDEVKEPETQTRAGGVFKGWSINADATEGDFVFGSKDLSSYTADTTVNVYAIFDSAPAFNVYFMNGVSEDARITTIKGGNKDDEVTVNDVKVPLDSTQAVTGWYTEKELTNKVDSVTIEDQDITLWPKIESGHYLYFSAESDASYTAPSFVAAGGKTEKPSDPTRPGYTFKGWATTAGATRADFTFGGTLGEDTTVYAVWEAQNTTYTVIYWQQNVNDSKDAADDAKTYDYAESKEITAKTGTEVSSTSAEAKTYKGFHLSTKTETVTVNGDGTTVLNVYYDRDLITINFYVWGAGEPTWRYNRVYGGKNSRTTYYGKVGNEYIELTYKGIVTPAYLSDINGEYTGTVYTYSRKNGYTVYTGTTYDRNTTYYKYSSYWGYVVLTYHAAKTEDHWYNGNTEYTGTFYTREVSNTNDWGVQQSFTGLYGQTLDQNGYTWPNDHWWQEGTDGGNFGFIGSFLDEDQVLNLYQNGEISGNHAYKFYKQNIDGSWPPEPANTIASNKGDSTWTFDASEGYDGFTLYQYRNGGNWKNVSVGDSVSSNLRNNDFEIRHTRNSYTLSFYNYNGISDADKKSVKYEDEISKYASYVPTKPSVLPADYTFQGWYKDPDCTVPFDFTQHMPANDLVAYAKWAAPTYTEKIYLDVNGGTSFTKSVEYGSTLSENGMPKVVQNGKTVQDGTTENGTVTVPDGYTWAGWATKSGDSYTIFNFNTKIYSDIDLYPYYINNTTYKITYDANGGSGSVTDGMGYSDGVSAVVKSGAGLTGPTDKNGNNKVFLGWATTADGNVAYYPNSKLTMNSDKTLYAVWGDTQSKTTVTYHANGGNGTDYTVDQQILNNGKYTLLGLAATRITAKEGYDFVGWSRNASGPAEFNPGAYVGVDNNANDSSKTNDIYAIWREHKTITVTAASKTVDYNGSEQSVSGFTQNTGANGIEISVDGATYYVTGLTASAKGTNAGSYTSKVTGTPVVKDASGNNVTKYFTVNTENGTLLINKKKVTVTAENKSKKYKANDPTLTAKVDGTIGSDTVQYSLSRAQGEDAGTYAITPTGATEQGNYDVEFKNGTLTITADDQEVIINITGKTATSAYDGTEHTASGYDIEIPAGISLTNANITCTGTAEAKRTNAGKTEMGLKAEQFSITGSENYSNVKFNVTDGYVEITKVAVTVTAVSTGKTYGEADPNLTATVSGTIAGQTVEYTVSREPGENVGTYKMTAAGAADQGNYTVTYVDGTFTINRAGTMTVSVTPYSGQYDGQAHTITATASVEGAAIQYSTDNQTWSDTAPTWTDVTSTQTVYVKATHQNYNEAAGQGTVTITPKELIVTTGSASKTYDGKPLTKKDGAAVTGIVDGESATVNATGTITEVGSTQNTYTMTWGEGTKQSNYTVKSANLGTLTVNAFTTPLVLVADGDTKVYDGTALTKDTYTVSGGSLPEGLSFANVTISGSQTNVGSSDNTITSFQVVDANNAVVDIAKNFTSITTQPGTLTVTPKAVTVTAADNSKKYGTTDPTLTATVDGNLNGDVINYSVSRAQGENVGDYQITATGAATQGNYSVTYVPGNFNIYADPQSVVIKITGHKATYTYDAKAHTVEGYDIEIPNGINLTEDDIEFDGTQSITETAADTYPMGLLASMFSIVDTNENYSNVSFQVTDGQLVINRKAVTVTAKDAGKIYGEADPETFEATVSGLEGSDTIRYTVSRAAGEEVGPYIITPTGDAQQGSYDITYETGTFTISKAGSNQLNVTDYNAPYDGEAHSITVTANAAGTTIEYSTDGNNWSETAPTWTDVTAAQTVYVRGTNPNYETVTGQGTVTITKKELTVTTLGDKKEYDGTPLTKADGATVDGLVGTETATVNPNGTITEVGTTPNTYSMTWGTAKETNYTIKKENIGTLEITRNTTELELTADSASRDYTGEALTKNSYKVTKGSLPEGMKFSVTVSGSQTNVGSSDNLITSVKVVDADNNDHTASFTGITTVKGTLTVNPAKVTVTADNKTKVYDNNPANPTQTDLTATVTGLIGEDTVNYTVSRAAGENVGTYDITPTGEATQGNYTVEYAKGTLTITPVTEKLTVKITGHTASNQFDGAEHSVSGYDITLPSGTTLTESDITCNGDATATGINAGNYNMGLAESQFGIISTNQNYSNVKFEVTDGKQEITRKPVTVTAQNNSKVYGEEDPVLTAVADGLVGDDKLVYTVTRTPGEDVNTYPITAAGEATQGNYTVTYKPAIFTITAADTLAVIANDYTGTYDGAVHTITYSATDMIGTTFQFSTDNVNWSNTLPSYTDVTAGETVYVKATNSNYEDAFGQATVTINPKQLSVATGSDSKQYDGTPLTKNEAGITGLVNDETASVTATGSQTDVGQSDNTYSITWGTAKADNYTVDENLGKLTVTENNTEVTLTAATDSKTYDGTPLTNNGVTSTGLPKGFTVEATATGSQTDAGSGANVVDEGYVIKNAAGEDKTSYFTNVTKQPGTLTVDKAKLSVVTDPGFKVYDGEPLKASGNISGFVNGEKAEFTVTGSQTAVGTSYNTYEISWNGTAKQGNYYLYESIGTLTVSEYSDEIVVTTTGGTFTYDGNAHGATVSVSTLPKGYELETASSDATATYVTDGKVNAIADLLVIRNAEGDDVTSRLNIRYVDGSVEIIPAAVTVTITGHNDSTTYDGASHTVTGYDAAFSNNLYTAADFTFSGNATATRTDAGKTQMGLAADQFTNTNDNFGPVTFDVTDGYQEITPIEEVTVTITGHTDTKDYDGTEHSVSGYEVSIDNDLYKKAYFTFSGNAEAVRTDAGQTDMGLDADQFANTNENFKKVTFQVTDGYQKINPIDVTVTITGHYDSTTYDGEEHTVTGYDAAFSNSLYTEDDFTFTGTAEAKRTEEGKTDMGLASDQFANTNNNFKTVTFNVTDGYQEIVPIDEVTVTIVGRSNTSDYDGTEHSVSGYDVTISNPLYKEADFTFSGTAEAKRTDAGQTDMGLAAEQFANTNKNFAKVTFNVTDGYQKITPINVTVTITGHNDSTTYDGAAHTVTGYDATFSNDLYTAADFTFSGEATATRTDAGKTDMGLTAAQFANTNDNFASVTFEVTDGYQEITPVEEVTVTITGHNDTKDYDGTEHSISGYEVSIDNDLYKEADFTFSGNAEAVRTDAGQTDMGLDADQFANTNQNFKKVTFNVTDGYQKINPIDVTVTITGHYDSTTYDGEEHTVTGYDATFSNSLYTEDDFTFTGTAEAKRTEEGKTDMGLTADQFANTNSNFKTVTFDVTDGYQEIVPIDEVTVTIVGRSNTSDYDGTEHSVSGYDVTISNPLYKEADFTFSGTAEAKRTDAGQTDMGLAAEQFANTNKNFKKVTFNVTDGYQKITQINVTVTITGHNDSRTYDGESHTVTGYGATFSNDLYTEADFTFSGDATATRTDAGKTDMGLTANQFTNNNANFRTVTFDVTDGYQTITPVETEVKVTITGAAYEGMYDGDEHKVEGYEASADNDLYDVDKDIAFDGTATATATNAGEVKMELAGEQFSNTNANFANVTFDVTDGGVNISKRNVTITSGTSEKVYDGDPLTDHRVKIGGDGFVDGEGLVYYFTGSQTNVGQSDNEFTFTFFNGGANNAPARRFRLPAFRAPAADAGFVDAGSLNPTKKTLEENYEITPEFGTLAVTEPTDQSKVITKENNGVKEQYALGDEVVFNISVTNIYDEVKTITIMEDEAFDAVLEQSVFENVAAGETVTTTATHKITEADILAGTYNNKAKATFSDETSEWTGEDDVDPEKPNPQMTVDKSVTSEAPEGGYKLNDEIEFTIKVTNSGNLTLTNVNVKDELVGLEETVEKLEVGETKTYVKTYAVTEDDIIAGKVVNKATATGKGPDDEHDPDPTDDTVTEDNIEDPKPGFTVHKEITNTPANGSYYVIGETITYRITAENTGNVTLTNVTIKDDLTGGEWTIERLAPYTTYEQWFQTSHVVTEANALERGGVLTNTATGEATPPAVTPEDPENPDNPETPETPDKPIGGTPGSVDAPIEEVFPLGILKSDEAGAALAGATLAIYATANGAQTGEALKTWVSAVGAQLQNLPAGNYVLVETAAPNGYNIADPIPFTMSEDGKISSNGTITTTNGIQTLVMIDTTVKGVSEDETEATTEATTESGKKKGASDKKANAQTEAKADETAKAVKTGDETPILPLAGTLAVSALAIILLLEAKRRREEEES